MNRPYEGLLIRPIQLQSRNTARESKKSSLLRLDDFSVSQIHPLKKIYRLLDR